MANLWRRMAPSPWDGDFSRGIRDDSNGSGRGCARLLARFSAREVQECAAGPPARLSWGPTLSLISNGPAFRRPHSTAQAQRSREFRLPLPALRAPHSRLSSQAARSRAGRRFAPTGRQLRVAYVRWPVALFPSNRPPDRMVDPGKIVSANNQTGTISAANLLNSDDWEPPAPCTPCQPFSQRYADHEACSSR